MKSDKSSLILDAAEQLMCVMPDKDITVNHIAKKAGIGKGSIYYYYESKDDILHAVIERNYKKALREYFADINSDLPALEKIKMLFNSIIKKEFHDKQKNMIIALHLHEDAELHNKLKVSAISEVSPVLAELLREGIAEGTIHTDAPDECAEMIVAVITFLFDRSLFPENPDAMNKKMKILADVLETCLKTPKGGFEFFYNQ